VQVIDYINVLHLCAYVHYSAEATSCSPTSW